MKIQELWGKTSLTGRVFRLMVLSFFVSNIMTVLGSMIDGFVVGNTMNAAAVAAVGFASPFVILFSIIGNTAGVGFKSTAIKYLSRGDTENAGKALGEALLVGIGFSVVIMILTLIFAPTFVGLLNIEETGPVYLPCVSFLRGTAFGLPAITAMAILTQAAQIEGRRRAAVLSAAIMILANVIGDIIGVHLLHVGIFGLTLGTSISYYLGAAYLCSYYRHQDALLRPVLQKFSLKSAFLVNKAGLPAGLTSAFFSLTLVVKANLINGAISMYSTGDIGLQAYNVIVQVNYFVNAFMGSTVAVMFLLADMFSAEEDRENFKRVIKNVIIYGLTAITVISLILWVFAGGITRVYLGEVDHEVIIGTAAALRAYAFGLLFQMILLFFSNYIQIFSHMIIPNILFLISNVFLVLYGTRFGAEFVGEQTINTTAGIYGGISVSSVIALLTLPVCIAIIHKMHGCKDRLWMLPKDFGVSEDNEISAVIEDLDDVMEFSDRTLQFCEDKGDSPRIAFHAALSVEEMAKNVIEHGFTKNKKDNMLSVRVVHKGDELIIRMRDDCPGFDPRKKYEQIYAHEDVSRMIGIKMTMAEAKEVRYTSMFRLNNLLIRIGSETT